MYVNFHSFYKEFFHNFYTKDKIIIVTKANIRVDDILWICYKVIIYISFFFAFREKGLPYKLLILHIFILFKIIIVKEISFQSVSRNWFGSLTQWLKILGIFTLSLNKILTNMKLFIGLIKTLLHVKWKINDFSTNP